MPAGASKGEAICALQKALGITRAQTAVFGDYLNDLSMYDHAAWGFAVDNAHPDVSARALFQIPSNDDAGVITTLRAMLSRPHPLRVSE